MATIDLGRLGFVNKGTYNNSTTYEKNDLVQFTDGGILSTYLYIDSTAQSGQAPSSSGTAGSRWTFFAKGVADVVASAGNNKVLVTDGSGSLSPVSIGSAGQTLKVNSGANGYEFGTITSAVSKVETFTSSTRNTTTGAGFSTKMSGTYTKLSSSSKILVMVVYFQFGESAGSGTSRFNFGNSTEDGGTSYGNTANHSKMVSNNFYFSGNTQTGSLSWTFQIENMGGTVFNPSSSDESRISNNSKSVVTIMEYA